MGRSREPSGFIDCPSPDLERRTLPPGLASVRVEPDKEYVQSHCSRISAVSNVSKTLVDRALLTNLGEEPSLWMRQ